MKLFCMCTGPVFRSWFVCGLRTGPLGILVGWAAEYMNGDIIGPAGYMWLYAGDAGILCTFCCCTPGRVGFCIARPMLVVLAVWRMSNSCIGAWITGGLLDGSGRDCTRCASGVVRPYCLQFSVFYSSLPITRNALTRHYRVAGACWHLASSAVSMASQRACRFGEVSEEEHCP